MSRALDISNPVFYDDINFELCCIMFNIGTMHAVIAANETRSDLDVFLFNFIQVLIILVFKSIKNAFMHFQYAAWPFQYLRDTMGCNQYAAADFESPLLTFYLNVFLVSCTLLLLI